MYSIAQISLWNIVDTNESVLWDNLDTCIVSYTLENLEAVV